MTWLSTLQQLEIPHLNPEIDRIRTMPNPPPSMKLYHG